MKKALLFLAICSLSLAACKNSKKAKSDSTAAVSTEEAEVTKNQVPATPETPEQPRTEDISKYEPKIADSLYFMMQRTPCFGQCPVYTIRIYQSGNAYLEGKRFFDYEGWFKTKFSESEMIQIKTWAKEAGYWKMDHVYDAPVTDLPSTTTALKTDEQYHWVYNRMNSPDELRTFERNIETLIKDQDWVLYKAPVTEE
ncbi:MAG: DUF6438 domain-containing protein [Salibacteraceae bacterium]|nr:DUF6438 domain-containing protein [Salibacteraceae bacterium]